MVREGLIAVFNSDEDIEIVGHANDGDAAIVQAEKLLPDVVLMDINMPNMNGIEAAVKIKLENPFIKVLLLTMLNTRQFVLEALEKNLDGYILKMADVKELKDAISKVYAGDYYFDREITEDLIMSGVVPESRSPNENEILTAREKEILVSIAKGMTTAEIADAENLSAHTVFAHRRNILKKLDCKNTAEIVNYAIRSGLFKV